MRPYVTDAGGCTCTGQGRTWRLYAVTARPRPTRTHTAKSASERLVFSGPSHSYPCPKPTGQEAEMKMCFGFGPYSGPTGMN